MTIFRTSDAPEETVEPVVRLELENREDGRTVAVNAVDGAGDILSTLVIFDVDGTMFRCTSVSSGIEGLQLGPGSRIVDSSETLEMEENVGHRSFEQMIADGVAA